MSSTIISFSRVFDLNSTRLSLPPLPDSSSQVTITSCSQVPSSPISSFQEPRTTVSLPVFSFLNDLLLIRASFLAFPPQSPSSSSSLTSVVNSPTDLSDSDPNFPPPPLAPTLLPPPLLPTSFASSRPLASPSLSRSSGIEKQTEMISSSSVIV